MADLSYIQQRQEVSITGQDSVGDQVNYVGADANGNMLVKDYSVGPVTAGAAASGSSLIGGQFNTTLPTLTNGQQVSVQLDSSGRIIIRPLTSSTDSVTSIQGTSPWITQDKSDGTPGSTSPLTSLQIGGSDGTNLRTLSTDTTGKINLNNISGTVSLPTGAATSALQSSTQGSVGPGTAAINSDLVGGIYNSSAITLTNSQQSALQLDTNGNLKTTVPADLMTSGTLSALNASLSLNTNGVSSATIIVTGTFVGTITVFNNYPGVSRSVYVQGQLNSAFQVSITAGGIYRVIAFSPTLSLVTTMTSYTSGSANVIIMASSGTQTAEAYQLNASNLLTSSWLSDGSGTALGPAVTLSGVNYLPVVQASSATPGTPVPVRVTAIGGSDGTNTQAISTDTTGKLNINNISGTISLPTGAASASNLTGGGQKTQVVDGTGNVIGSVNNTLNVNTKNSLTPLNTTTAAVVTATQAQIIAANTSRRGLILNNVSATGLTISISFGTAGNGYGYGITLLPGGTFQMDEYCFTTGAVYAVSTGTTTLSYQEFN